MKTKPDTRKYKARRARKANDSECRKCGNIEPCDERGLCERCSRKEDMYEARFDAMEDQLEWIREKKGKRATINNPEEMDGHRDE